MNQLPLSELLLSLPLFRPSYPYPKKITPCITWLRLIVWSHLSHASFISASLRAANATVTRKKTFPRLPKLDTSWRHFLPSDRSNETQTSGKIQFFSLGPSLGLSVWTNNFFKSWRLKFKENRQNVLVGPVHSQGKSCRVLVSFENFNKIFWVMYWGVSQPASHHNHWTVQDYNKGVVPLNPQNVFSSVTANPRIYN